MSHIKDESPEVISSVIREVSKIVSSMAGIQLGQKQESMIDSRLRSRIIKLGLSGFSEYLRYLKAHEEAESQALLSLMTTHHTYFFREFSHFEFLLNHFLPQAIERARKRADKTIQIWSAACSKGQEVYSLAMFFNFHLKQMAPDVFFHIWGSDIDPESVKYAMNGVYRNEELGQSPAMYVNGHWTKGTGNVAGYSKVKKEIQEKCSFTPANLLDLNKFLQGKTFDLIFCRNVFIYFNQDQIRSITNSFLKNLDKEGSLILGVSETLNGLGLDVQLVGPSAYQFKSTLQQAPKAQLKVAVRTEPIRVLCVDDSGTILALLKKILTPTNGFQVVATAKNGLEALEMVKKHELDLITLDLHMPELDGVGFLKRHDTKKVPVLVLSSINREDTTIAQKAIQSGASDYVEKPSLENLAQAGNEIRSKIKTILQGRATVGSVVTSTKPAAQSGTNAPGAASAAKASSGLKSPAISTPSKKSVTTPMKTSVSPRDSKQSFSGKKKVLIVDDSQTIRNLLTTIISKDPYFEVVATAEKPSQVEALIKEKKPDVITLDINMPEMDGVKLLSIIHPKFQIPTVMISSISKEEGPQVLKALEIGAVDYIQKPQMNSLAESSALIIERLKIAANAKVTKKVRGKKAIAHQSFNTHSIVVIGSSTGGTEAVRVILESMPDKIPPILVTQHIPPVFSAAFAARLNELFKFEVREARDGDEIKPNLVLIAPGGQQMGVKKIGDKLIVKVNDDAPVNRHKPSVDYLYKSVADQGLSNSVAVILTGMGADGAREMKTLRDLGVKTIAQNEQTCVVYGMPREAVAKGGAEHVLPLETIAQKILSLVEVQSSGKKVEVNETIENKKEFKKSA